jgi:DNA-binding response OmpR family regulator
VADPTPLNILVVDDEAPLREMLSRSFEREGHRVLAVADASTALDRASTDSFDVVLLDVALGGGADGNDVCRELRARRNVVPVIMLTARDSEADAVLGLEAGADDYVTKPFGLAELRSRIRAVLRRVKARGFEGDVLTVDSVKLDRASREVTLDGEPVQLTFSEFELLNRLMSDPGRLFNRQELLRAIWGDSAYRDPRAIDVHVRHLREKLEEQSDQPRLILTVRGAGYRLRGPQPGPRHER